MLNGDDLLPRSPRPRRLRTTMLAVAVAAVLLSRTTFEHAAGSSGRTIAVSVNLGVGSFTALLWLASKDPAYSPSSLTISISGRPDLHARPM